MVVKTYIFILLILLIVLPLISRQLLPIIPLLISLYGVSLFPYLVKNRKDVWSLFLNNKKSNIVWYAFIFFLLSAVISTIFSVDVRESLFTLLFLISIFAISLFLKISKPTFIWKEKISLVFLGIVTVLSIISLYNTFIQNYISFAQEGVSFFWIYYGHNHLSALHIFAIPLGIYFLYRYWNNTFLRLLFFLVLYVIVFSFINTFARASIVSLFTSLLFLLLVNFRNKYSLLLLSIPLLAMVILFVLPLPNAKKVNPSKREISFEVRSLYWRQAWETAIQKPLTGSGLNTFRMINLNHPTKSPLNSYYAHNFFMQMLSDAGFLGFFSSVFLMGAVCWKLFEWVYYKTKNHESFLYLMITAGMFASLLNTLVDFDWQLPTVFFVLWTLFGLIA